MAVVKSKANRYYFYKNTEPTYRGFLTQEETEVLMQVLHNHNAVLDEEEDKEQNAVWFSLLGKLMEWGL